VNRYLPFLAVGTLLSTVEEFLTVVVLRGDVGAYVVTLLGLFPVFLTLVWFCGRWIDRRLSHEPTRQSVHFFAFGLVGLMFEWFVIGLSPWSNPGANPLLMSVFQLGMFSFWATVAFVPRLWVSENEIDRRTARAVMKYFVPYFAMVYVAVALVPESTRFGTVIVLIVLGYSALNVVYLRHFVRMSGGT
jgi:hypothetical protein